MKTIRLRIAEPDDTWHEFLIDVHDDNTVDIRGEKAPRCDADRTVSVFIAHLHCPICLAPENADKECVTDVSHLIMKVELADA